MEEISKKLRNIEEKIERVEAWKPEGFYEQLSKVGQLLFLNEEHKELTIQLQKLALV